MKKIILTLFTTIIFAIIILIETFVLKKIRVFGIDVDIYLLMIFFVGTYIRGKNGLIIVFLLGLLQDLVISKMFGVTTIIGIITYLITYKTSEIFYEDTKLINMFKIIMMSAIYVLVDYLIVILVYKFKINEMIIFKEILINIVVNLLLLIILYPLIKKIGDNLEEIYVKNNILTRYFTK